MPLSKTLTRKLGERPKKPFRGLSASLIAGLLNRPRLLQPLFQYFLPLLGSLLDRSTYFFVSRHRDVREVMERDDDFAIGPMVGPAMVCGFFVLGTDRVPLYREDLMLLWHAFYDIPPQSPMPAGGPIAVPRPANLPPLLQSIRTDVDRILATVPAGGSLDLVQQLLKPICTGAVQRHLGLRPADVGWADTLWDVLASLALRIILPGSTNPLESNSAVTRDLTWASQVLRIAIRDSVTDHIRSGTPATDITARMYDVLAARSPQPPLRHILGTIVRNIAGLAITGCHPIAKAAAQAVDILLRNPRAFDGAVVAARAGDEGLFWRYIDEALRFFPPFPLVTRACARDTTIGIAYDRPRKVRAGQTVTIGLLPAMFDSAAIPFPFQFRTDRTTRDSLVFGRGVHACFGYQFARDVLIAILMPVFARGFQRASGHAGRLKFDIVVPQSMTLTLQ